MSNYHQFEQRAFSFGDRMTWAVQRIILLNIIVFGLQLVLDVFNVSNPHTALGMDAPGGFVIDYAAYSPSAFFGLWLWTPFTYMFIHGNLSHLFFNMLWLFFFGPEVERTLGTRQFVRFYVLCGALGVFGEAVRVMIGGPDVSVVGASGAVMGVLIAFAVINPDREFFLFPLPMPINARAMVVLVLFLNFLSAIGMQGGRTSFMTHLGGMAVAYAYMKIIPWINRTDFSFRRRRHKARKVDLDRLGEAIDNIFEIDGKRRKRD